MIKRSNKIRLAIMAALAAQGGMVSTSSFAQPAVEEIIVTSTRRATNVQDVPIAITALTGEMLETQNIENAQDITAVIPNLMIRGSNQGSGQSSINMRGIPDVGIYVDGVWQVSDNGLLQRQFVELDRLEVLRGPQGTLYGRDSTGGSIHLFTKKPSEEFGALLKMNTGDFDRLDVSASVDIPLTETLLSRWTFASYNKDGYVKSINNGYNYGDLNNDVFRGDLVWTPTDRFSARLIYSDEAQVSTTARIQNVIDHDVAYGLGFQIGNAEAVHIASLAAGGPGFDSLSTVSGYPGGSVGEYENTAVLRMPNTVAQKQTVVHLDYEISDTLAIKYIYGKTAVESARHTDYAGSLYNFFSQIDQNIIDLASHEIQLTGDFDRFHWNVGAYTWDQKDRGRITEMSMTDFTFSQIDANQQTLDYADVLASDTCSRSPSYYGLDFEGQFGPSAGPPNGAGPATDAATGWPFACDWAGGGGWPGALGSAPGGRTEEGTWVQEEGYSFFGQLTYDISDKWDVTVGVRYHEQDNTYHEVDVTAFVDGRAEARPTRLDIPFGSIDYALAAPIDPASRLALNFDNTSIRFASSYDITDNSMVYLGYNEGFNSGGIDRWRDDAGPAFLEYDPQIIENLEIGIKGDYFDGRLRANVALFQTDWVDIQLQTLVQDRITGASLTTLPRRNAATGEASGVEFELTYAATENLLLGANIGFLDTKYKGVTASGPVTVESEFGGAPEETYSFSAQYDWNLRGGDMIMARIQSNYFSEYWRSENPALRQAFYGQDIQAGDIWLVNARVSYVPADTDYELSFWVNNLTDSYNLNSGFMDSIWQFDFAGIDAPREMGVSLQARF